MSTVLEIRALTKRLYAGVSGCTATVLALTNVWLRLDAGERVAVCGPRGAGKSVLLLCAAGLLRPDGGRVRVEGAAAFVGAEPPSLGGLTVHELLEWRRRSLLAAGGDVPMTALAALCLTGCEALATVRVRLLAPEAARRVAVARALVSRPSVLVVDGPSGTPSVDWISMERTLARIADAGVGVLCCPPAATRLPSTMRAIWLAAPYRALERGRRDPRDGRGGGTPAASRRAVAERAPR